MPSPKRNRRERTQEWASIQQWTLWPEQELYEQIRPLILFHETAGERAKEIDVPERTLARKADAFEQYGMAACLHLKSMVVQEKAQRRSLLRCVNSSLTCMLSILL